MGNVTVDFRFLENGWKTETRTLTEEEFSALLEDATYVSNNISEWSSLQGITLKLKDGRKCVLTEENTPSWEGSSEGWINVYVTEEW